MNEGCSCPLLFFLLFIQQQVMSTTSRAPARKDTREIAMRITTEVPLLDEPFDTKKREHNLLHFKSNYSPINVSILDNQTANCNSPNSFCRSVRRNTSVISTPLHREGLFLLKASNTNE